MKSPILVCDDEEGIRESLKLILENDYDVILTETGDEAIRRMKEDPVGLAILDIKMPKKDGLETLKELKKVNPSAKVIIATGYKSVDVAQEAIKLGASDYIVKPFDKAKIISTIRKHSAV